MKAYLANKEEGHLSDAWDGHEVTRAQRTHREIDLWLVNERHIDGAHAGDDIHQWLDGDARLRLGLHAPGGNMLFGTDHLVTGQAPAIPCSPYST